MLFNADIVNLLFKNNVGNTKRFILFSWFGVLWLSTGGWWRLRAESLIWGRLESVPG